MVNGEWRQRLVWPAVIPTTATTYNSRYQNNNGAPLKIYLFLSLEEFKVSSDKKTIFGDASKK
jgi:hypothetical protein